MTFIFYNYLEKEEIYFVIFFIPKGISWCLVCQSESSKIGATTDEQAPKITERSLWRAIFYMPKWKMHDVCVSLWDVGLMICWCWIFYTCSACFAWWSNPCFSARHGVLKVWEVAVYVHAIWTCSIGGLRRAGPGLKILAQASAVPGAHKGNCLLSSIYITSELPFGLQIGWWF